MEPDRLDLDGADLSERLETLGRYIDAAEEALGDAQKPRATVADPAFYTQLAYSLVIAASRCLTGINAMIYEEQTARRDAMPRVVAQVAGGGCPGCGAKEEPWAGRPNRGICYRCQTVSIRGEDGSVAVVPVFPIAEMDGSGGQA